MTPRENRRVQFDKWIESARLIHGSKYTYDAASYAGVTRKVRICCPDHGWFEQRANAHTLQKAGCLDCSGRRQMTVATFTAAASERHAGKYDYSLVTSYENQNSIVKIICPDHGPFEKRAAKHLSGQGCQKCSYSNRNNHSRLNTEVFLARAKEIHGDKYTYTGEYTTTHEKLSAICNTCSAVFEVRPSKHFHEKAGCPKCANQLSRGEDELAVFARSVDTSVVQKTRKLIPPYEIDVFSAAAKIGVEYNGLYWHSDARPDAVQKHKRKSDLMAALGLRLIHIFEDEWMFRRTAVENLVQHALGKAVRGKSARELLITKRPATDVASFFETNHIQGAAPSGQAYCLLDGDTVVASMVFSKSVSSRGEKAPGWELTRFASSANIPGAGSRLFRAFLRDTSATQVVSFSENRLFTGGLYKALGFTATHITRPSYWVVVDGVRHHKSGFRKSRLKHKVPNYSAAETEKVACHRMGWFRVYDCGLTKWVWASTEVS